MDLNYQKFCTFCSGCNLVSNIGCLSKTFAKDRTSNWFCK